MWYLYLLPFIPFHLTKYVSTAGFVTLCINVDIPITSIDNVVSMQDVNGDTGSETVSVNF